VCIFLNYAFFSKSLLTSGKRTEETACPSCKGPEQHRKQV
jgi:hypothetical protein